MHVLEDLRRDDELIQEPFRARFARPATTMHLRFALPRFLLTLRPACRMCGCAPRRPMNISLIICVRICSIWCSLPGRDSTQIFILRRFSPRRTSVWCGADILSERAAAFGPLEREDLEAFRRCSSMPSPTATVLPIVPATAGLIPKSRPHRTGDALLSRGITLSGRDGLLRDCAQGNGRTRTRPAAHSHAYAFRCRAKTHRSIGLARAYARRSGIAADPRAALGADSKALWAAGRRVAMLHSLWILAATFLRCSPMCS